MFDAMPVWSRIECNYDAIAEVQFAIKLVGQVQCIEMAV